MPTIAFYCFWIYRKEFDKDKKFFFMEMFADVKNTKWARLYSFMLFTKRVIMVFLIILLLKAPRAVVFSLILGKNVTILISYSDPINISRILGKQHIQLFLNLVKFFLNLINLPYQTPYLIPI